MSRIGKKTIELPKNVEVTLNGAHVKVKGPKGTLEREIHASMTVEKAPGALHIVPVGGASEHGNFHGLTRSVVNNMVVGVSTGFSKSLILKGVGYRAQVKGNELHLTLGYSHPVIYEIPKGLEVKVDKHGNDPLVVVAGADKEVVGQAAADIRSFRKPEPYHGKGVRYIDEVIVTKVGKSAGKK